MVGRFLDLAVVIPTHDRVDLLIETVKSVLAQTVQPREIIVVDNGTSNRAALALASFGERVRVTSSQPNVKQIARNSGIELASSEWIATLDDDDLLAPDYLAEMARPMKDGRVDIISSDHRKFRGDEHEAKTNFEQAPRGYWRDIPGPPAGESWSYVGKFPLDRLLRRVPVYPSTMVLRRAFALEIGGYDPRMLGIKAEDLEFLIRALTKGNLALVWKPLVHYRLHAGNDTANVDGQAIGRWRIFEFAWQHHPDLPAYFINELANDLPQRRQHVYGLAHRLGDVEALRDLRKLLAPKDFADIYKRAFRAGNVALMQDVGKFIPPTEWTMGMRGRRWVSALPEPMLRALRKAAISVLPRGKQGV